MVTTILQELVRALEERFDGRPAPAVRAIHRPPGGSREATSPFTLVVLDADPPAAGLAYDLLEDEPARASYDALDLAGLAAAGDALALARRALAPEPAERVVGYAACHALSQLLLRTTPARESAEDLVSLMRLDGADHVGLVGHAARMVRGLVEAGAGRVTVLERPGREPRPGETGGASVSTRVEDLAACTKVLVTSTTLLNDTFDEVERHSRGAAFRAVYGPGAGLLPEVFFSRGIDAVGGLLVVDAEELVRRQLGGLKWREARRRVVFVPGSGGAAARGPAG